MKREQKNIDVRAKKMTKGRMEPFEMPIMVRAVPIIV
jgi:hypothetical protein